MRRKVLLVQPSMQPPGGGNGVAAWTLQALVSGHDVTVLTWWPVEVPAINRFFGTSLDPSQFRTLTVPAAWRAVPDHLPVPAALLRSALLMRYTRRVTAGFDVIVGIHNETDYGRRGIQYVHYPAYLRPRPEVDLRWYHRASPLLRAYYTFADRLAGFSFERMRANLTLTNSNWTAAHVKRFLGIEARTVYPPVAGAASTLPWAERRRGFLAMGRISPEKEYERLIRILARVRRHVPELTFTIVGTWDRAGERYYARVVQAAREADPNQAWIAIRSNLSRDEVRQLIAVNRYGIHGMREEHFGMAPAEMVRGGMIVWVPNGGGQTEIVGEAPLLRYDTDDEAVERIVHVMADDEESRRLRAHLARRGELFGTERFVGEMRAIVESFRE